MAGELGIEIQGAFHSTKFSKILDGNRMEQDLFRKRFSKI